MRTNGSVGAPPAQVFYWSFRVQSKWGGGVVAYAETDKIMTLADGIARVLALGQLYGANYISCGTYQGYSGPESYCSYDGGFTYKYGVAPQPPPVPAPALAPFPFARVSFTPTAFFSPLYGDFAPFPVYPTFRAYRRRVTWGGPVIFSGLLGPKDNGRVGFGYDEGTPVWQPGLSEEEKKSYFPWKQYSDATKNLQLAINDVLKKNGCGTIGVDGKLGPGTCGAAKKATELEGADAIVGPPSTCQEFGPPPPCGVSQPTPPPPPECTPQKPCPAGFICVDGKCAIIPTTPTPPPTSSTSSSSGLGLGIAALGAAALGAIFIGMRPPKLPKSAAGRLQENRRRGRRRRRAA